MDHEIKDFQIDVIERSKTIPVLVDFWADWCGPCKVLGPVLEKLAGQNGDRWVLAKVDTEANQKLARQYNIRGIPHVKLFVDGAPVNEFTGQLPEASVVQWLNKVLPGKYKKILQTARQYLDEGKIDEARNLLNEVLATEPMNEEARVLLARTQVTTDLSAAVALVKDIEENSEFFSTVDAIRSFKEFVDKLSHPESLAESEAKKSYLAAIGHIARGEYDEAVSLLIEALRSDRYYDDDGPRKACVAIFKYLGEEHEITIKHRRDFGSALYV
jgi:putative thioredoxin